jgi:hypothetical protein
VEHVPRGQPALMSALSRVMIAKSVYDFVPQRAKHLNEKILAQGNPNILDRQVSAKEILDFQIARCRND